MRFFKPQAIMIAFATLYCLNTPLAFAADALDNALKPQEVVMGEKPLVPLLIQKRMLIPNTTQSASLSLYNNANIVVQLMSDQAAIMGEVELKADNSGQFHFYSPGHELLADLVVEASDDQKWHASGSLNHVEFKTVSSRVVAFDHLKVKKSRSADNRSLEGVLEASNPKLSIPWTVMLGRSEHSGVSILFKPRSVAAGEDQQYFILKKTPFGLSELNYKTSKRHLFIERQQGKNTQTSVLLEYTPSKKVDMLRKDIAKAQLLVKEANISFKIQTYHYTTERRPPYYREIQLDYNFQQKSFALAEDRLFELQGSDYVMKSHQSLDFGSNNHSLSDVMADIINNKDKILGDTGISVPAELIDLVSLFDPNEQDDLIRDGLFKHISTFIVTDDQDSMKSDLLASSMETVLFDQGLTPIIKFLGDFSNVFDTTMKVYDQTAQVEFDAARRALTEKMQISPPAQPIVNPAPEKIVSPEELHAAMVGSMPENNTHDAEMDSDVDHMGTEDSILPQQDEKLASPAQEQPLPMNQPLKVEMNQELSKQSETKDLSPQPVIEAHSQQLKVQPVQMAKEIKSSTPSGPAVQFVEAVPPQYEVYPVKTKDSAFEAFRVVP